MARRRITGVDLSGPFFQRDPVKTWRENVKDFMDEVAKVGEADVGAQLRASQGNRAQLSIGGRVSHYVVGRTKSLSGKRWATTAVVSVRPASIGSRKAIAVMAAAAEIEKRERVFARAASHVRRAKANLLKGLT